MAKLPKPNSRRHRQSVARLPELERYPRLPPAAQPEYAQCGPVIEQLLRPIPGAHHRGRRLWLLDCNQGSFQVLCYRLPSPRSASPAVGTSVDRDDNIHNGRR